MFSEVGGISGIFFPHVSDLMYDINSNSSAVNRLKIYTGLLHEHLQHCKAYPVPTSKAELLQRTLNKRSLFIYSMIVLRITVTLQSSVLFSSAFHPEVDQD